MSLRGVFCAAATPLKADLSPDHDLLVEHVKRLLADGCHGVAMLGTTSEANSFSMAERKAMLEAVVKSGVDPRVLMPGTGLAAIPETVELTRHALSLGVTRCVVLPPFYYKGVSDEGLLDAYSRIIEGVADERLEIVLYHIPQISAVPLSFDLIEALIAKFPGTIVGVKDSAGDLEHMKELVARFPGLSIFAGADPLMLPLLEAGGAGCITATSNLLGTELRTVFDYYADASAADKVAKAQAKIIAYRNVSNSYVQIPTIKAMIAHRTGNLAWRRVRPPFVALDAASLADLDGKLAELGRAD
jgi:4-hydroxy-tetrahydrodipicolinate synthase